jgi:hypothetical protein
MAFPGATNSRLHTLRYQQLLQNRRLKAAGATAEAAAVGAGAASGAGAARLGVGVAEITTAIGTIENFAKMVGKIGISLATWEIIFSAAKGFAEGFEMSAITKFFNGLYDLATSISMDNIKEGFSALAEKVGGFIKKIPGVETAGKVLSYVGGKVGEVSNYIAKKWEPIGGAVSYGMQTAGEAMTNQAMSNRFSTGLKESTGNKNYRATWEGGDNTQARVDALGAMMGEFKAAGMQDRAKYIGEAIKVALSSKSYGKDGKELVGSEFSEILTQAFTGAFDKSKLLDETKNVAKNTKKDAPKPSVQNRGGC